MRRTAVPLTLAALAALVVRCEHSNSSSRTVTWGENSFDEMCIGFAYVSEP